MNGRDKGKGMEQPVVEVYEVEKSYGEQKVLDKVNLKLYKGNIYGLVGRNGSGKTVLMKCILGLTRPDGGKIFVHGQEIGRDREFASDTGFLIETPGFFNSWSGYENLRYFMNIRNKADPGRLKECLKMVGLETAGEKKVGKYSMGMRQRLGIAQALMERPGLLILDEPMNGLDNHGVEKIRDMLMDLRDRGTTILLASHNREDMEYLCDEEYEMDRGVLRKERV